MAVPVLVELREIADRLDLARGGLKFGSTENSILADTSIQIHDISRRLEPVSSACLRAMATHIISDVMARGWEREFAVYKVASELVTNIFMYASLIDMEPKRKDVRV